MINDEDDATVQWTSPRTTRHGVKLSAVTTLQTERQTSRTVEINANKMFRGDWVCSDEQSGPGGCRWTVCYSVGATH